MKQKTIEDIVNDFPAEFLQEYAEELGYADVSDCNWRLGTDFMYWDLYDRFFK